MAASTEVRDHYVYAQQAEYPYEMFERHAGLTDREAVRLRAWLKKQERDGWLQDTRVEITPPEYFTVGFKETQDQIKAELEIE